MSHAYFTMLNMIYVVVLPDCHREEPSRATWRSALELLLYKNGVEN
jgi:hypothetical protein